MIEEWTVENAGDIKLELLKDHGELNQSVTELLKTMINGLAERANEYYLKTNRKDHVFIDSEGELKSSITLAISQLAPTFKTEFPAWRGYSVTKSGNLDYWIYYKNRTFAVELKHTHKGFKRYVCKDKKSIFEKYNEALKQLERIEHDYSLYFLDSNKSIIKISFLTIVFQSKDGKVITDFNRVYNKIENSLDTLFEPGVCYRNNDIKLNASIDYKALWYLDVDLIYLERGRFPEKRAYPTVGFIGHIEVV